MAAPKPRTRLGLGLAAMAVGMALLPLPTGRYIVLGGERREGRGLRDYLPKWYAMTDTIPKPDLSLFDNYTLANPARRAQNIRNIRDASISCPSDVEIDQLMIRGRRAARDYERKCNEIYFPLLFHFTSRPVDPFYLDRALRSLATQNQSLQSLPEDQQTTIIANTKSKGKKIASRLKFEYNRLEGIRESFNYTRYSEIYETLLQCLGRFESSPDGLRREAIDLIQPLEEAHKRVEMLNLKALAYNQSMMVPVYRVKDPIVTLSMRAFGEDGLGRRGRAWTSFDGQVMEDESSCNEIDREKLRENLDIEYYDGLHWNRREDFPVKEESILPFFMNAVQKSKCRRPPNCLPYKYPETWPIGYSPYPNLRDLRRERRERRERTARWLNEYVNNKTVEDPEGPISTFYHPTEGKPYNFTKSLIVIQEWAEKLEQEAHDPRDVPPVDVLKAIADGDLEEFIKACRKDPKMKDVPSREEIIAEMKAKQLGHQSQSDEEPAPPRERGPWSPLSEHSSSDFLDRLDHKDPVSGARAAVPEGVIRRTKFNYTEQLEFTERRKKAIEKAAENYLTEDGHVRMYDEDEIPERYTGPPVEEAPYPNPNLFMDRELIGILKKELHNQRAANITKKRTISSRRRIAKTKKKTFSSRVKDQHIGFIFEPSEALPSSEERENEILAAPTRRPTKPPSMPKDTNVDWLDKPFTYEESQRWGDDLVQEDMIPRRFGGQFGYGRRPREEYRPERKIVQDYVRLQDEKIARWKAGNLTDWERKAVNWTSMIVVERYRRLGLPVDQLVKEGATMIDHEDGASDSESL
ncbi:hypothetical protein AAMO2058_001049200 [Amorphochlora amoebiformis]